MHAQEIAQHAERGVGRAAAARDDRRRASARRRAAHRARLHDRRQFVHRAARVRIDRGAFAELIDGGLQRGDLPGELAGRFAVARVLDLKRRVASTAGRQSSAEALHRAPSPTSTGSAKAPRRADRVGQSEIVRRRTAPVCRSAMTNV